MAKHYGREHDLIQLRICTDGSDSNWAPQHRFNLTGDRSIPFTTYAKFVIDTATSLGQGGDKGFFKSQAQTHIAHALEMLYELKRPVTLLGVFQLLSDRELLEEEMENLEGLLETSRRAAVCWNTSRIDFSTNRRSNPAACAKRLATTCNTS